MNFSKALMKLQHIIVILLFVAGFTYGDEFQDRWIEDPTSIGVGFEMENAAADASLTLALAGISATLSAPICSAPQSAGYEAELKLYTKYTLTLTGQKMREATIRLGADVRVDLLAKRGLGADTRGFKILVDGIEKSKWLVTNPDCNTPVALSWQVQVVPDSGMRPVGAADDSPWSATEANLNANAAPGDAAWLALGPGNNTSANIAALHWGVNMGRLNNGRQAGQIRLRQFGAGGSSDPSALVYSAPVGTAGEVTVVMSGSSLRQVKASEALADIVVTGSPIFEVRYYVPAYVGAPGQDGVYALLTGAVPFVTYKFERVGTAVDSLRITETRNQSTYVSEATYDSSTQTWSLTVGTGADQRIVTRAITIGSSTSRTEAVEVKTSSASAYKATEAYEKVSIYQNLGWQLKTLTVNPGANQLLTSYAFYTDQGNDGVAYSKLKSIVYPDGSWEAREYVPYFIGGVLQNEPGAITRVLRPWKDSPTGPSTATGSNSALSEYEYQELSNGTRYANQITNSFKASQTDARSWTRLEGFPEAASGSDLREEKYLVGVSDIGDMVTSKSYTDANPTKAGLPYCESYQNGTRKSFFYQKGTYTNGVFTVNESTGLDWRMTSVTGGAAGILSGDATTFETKTIEPLHIIPSQSIKQTKVVQQGNVVLRENYVVSAYDPSTGSSTTELLDQLFYTNDSLGHTTKIERKDPVTGAIRTIYASDWRSPSNNQDGDLKMSETDEFGVQTTYTYDGLKRVKTVTKKGIAAGGGFAAQGDIVTTFTYDAMDRVLTRVVSSGGSSLSTSYTYDLAGRLVSETSPEGLTTGYSYANGGRTTTITYPNTGTQIIDKYLDGRVKSITGTAVVNRFYDYGQTLDTGTGTFSPKNTTIETIGTSTSTRQKTYVTDLREVLTEERVPGALGATLVHDLAFNSFGQLTSVEKPTPNNTGIIRTLNEYDATGNLMGNVARNGLDVSPTTPAQFTLAST